MNKQTAVEWLVEQLNQSIGLTKFVNNCDEDYKSEILGIIEQAKEMEKQQMEDCWRFGRGSYIDKEPETFEQYHNEQYGK